MVRSVSTSLNSLRRYPEVIRAARENHFVGTPGLGALGVAACHEVIVGLGSVLFVRAPPSESEDGCLKPCALPILAEPTAQNRPIESGLCGCDVVWRLISAVR